MFKTVWSIGAWAKPLETPKLIDAFQQCYLEPTDPSPELCQLPGPRAVNHSLTCSLEFHQASSYIHCLAPLGGGGKWAGASERAHRWPGPGGVSSHLGSVPCSTYCSSPGPVKSSYSARSSFEEQTSVSISVPKAGIDPAAVPQTQALLVQTSIRHCMGSTMSSCGFVSCELLKL